MVDQYLQELAEETAPVATDVMGITDNNTQKLRKILFSYLAYEIQTSTPDTNVTGEIGVLDVVTMSSMTADRDYTLPTTATVGDRCGIAVVDGNDTYEILIKSGAAGDKINNVDHSSTEWSRLFIAGEKVTFVCIDAAGPHWLVETDGRIPCSTKLTRSAAQSIGSGALVKILLDTKTFDIGNIGDIVTSIRINIRRANLCIVTGYCSIDNMNERRQMVPAIYLNNTITWLERDYSPVDGKTLNLSAIGIKNFNVNDYLELYIFQDSGSARNTSTLAHGIPTLAISEIL